MGKSFRTKGLFSRTTHHELPFSRKRMNPDLNKAGFGNLRLQYCRAFLEQAAAAGTVGSAGDYE